MKTPEILGADPEAALHQVKRTWSPYHSLSVSARTRFRKVWASLGFNHGLASLLRYETDMALLRMRCAISPAYKDHVRDLAARRDLLVHLGCGNALLSGWLNLDCYPPTSRDAEILTLDLRQGLPLTAGSVAALFSEHFLEHLPFDTVRSRLLPEIRRVLQSGGSVRIGVPNGEYFIEQYLAARAGTCDQLFHRESCGKTPMMMLNEIAHGHGHYFVYDFETMSSLLAAAGFVNIRRCSSFDTSVEHFKGKDRVDDWRAAMTLYVEAQAASSPA